MATSLLNVIGLSLNGLGALVLVFCPPATPAREVLPDGRETIPDSYVLDYPQSDRKRWRYYVRQWGFRFGVILLAVGFGLQLIGSVY